MVLVRKKHKPQRNVLCHGSPAPLSSTTSPFEQLTMAAGPSSNPQVACAEAIALLYILHKVPERPSRNCISYASNSEAGKYSLPFEIESDLVCVLAFLSSVQENIDRIPAVCVHEHHSTKSLDVLIAVNQASYAEYDPSLRDIVLGFDKLFHSLSGPVPCKYCTSL